MKNSPLPSFNEHDTKLLVWWESPNDGVCESVRNALIKHLRARGFRIGIDPDTRKHYRSICRNHHKGVKGGLEVKVRLSGRCLEIQFFQNIAFSNTNGGEYDFDRRARMPYLIGKQYELERAKIAALFASLGLPTLNLDTRLGGAEFIAQQRAELEAFQGAGFYAREIPRYNKLSAANRELAEGDTVYFFGPHGSGGAIRRGIAIHNINNMWWVMLPGDGRANVGSFKLYHRTDFAELPRRLFTPREQAARIRNRLAAAVEAQRFECAIGLRDALGRLDAAMQPARAAA